MIYRVLLDGNDILDYQDRRFVLLGPTLEMEVNAAGSFEFTMPPAHEFYDEVKPLLSTIEVFEDERPIWFGRPIQIRTDFYNQKKVYCEGAFAFFNDTVQRLHEYQRVSLHGFFRAVIENHNGQADESRQFTVGNLDIPDKTVYRKLNYASTYDTLKKQCLNAEGGYIFLRREDGVNYIDWYQNMPYTSNQPVEFGLNLLDMTGDFDGSGIATCVIPLGEEAEGVPLTVGDVNGGSDLIVSAAVSTYGRITKAVRFPGVVYPETLYRDGLEYLQESQFDNLSIKCKASDIYLQNENYDPFLVGQTVRCHSVPHLLDRNLAIVAISLRLDTAEKDLTLGTVRNEKLTEIVAETNISSVELDIADALQTGLEDIKLNLEDTIHDVVDPKFKDLYDKLYDLPDMDGVKLDLVDTLKDLFPEDGTEPYLIPQSIQDILAKIPDLDSYSALKDAYDDIKAILSGQDPAVIGKLDPEALARLDDLGAGLGDPAPITELSRQLGTLSTDLGTIENTLGDTLAQIEKTEGDIADIENRLSHMESGHNWTHQINGAAATTGTVNFVTT